MKNLCYALFLILVAFLVPRAAIPASVAWNTPYNQPAAVQSNIPDSSLIYIMFAPAGQTSDFKRISIYGFKQYLETQSLDSVYRASDTVTGLTATVTDSVTCTKDFASNSVTVRLGAATGTSNATSHYIAHLCGDKWLPINTAIVVLPQITDTSVVFYGVKATVLHSDSLQLSNNATAFKNSGTFAITDGSVFTYPTR